MRLIIGLLLILVPVSAAALDCTPFQSFTCSQANYYDYMNGQPGEVVCGVDFTGWTMHVIEVTITVPGFYAFQGISAYDPGAFPANTVATTIMLMDGCSAGTCISSASAPDGIATLLTCLDAGTHTFLVASDTIDPTGFMNIGLDCSLTCEDAVTLQFPCALCGVVDTETTEWGELKSLYR